MLMRKVLGDVEAMLVVEFLVGGVEVGLWINGSAKVDGTKVDQGLVHIHYDYNSNSNSNVQ